MAVLCSYRAIVRPMLGRATPPRRRARPTRYQCRPWSRSYTGRTFPRLPRPSPRAICNSNGRPGRSHDRAPAYRGTIGSRAARARRDQAGHGQGAGRHARTRRRSGLGPQVHAADGPARMAQSRIGGRELERHAEDGGDQPGADRKLGQDGRDPAPALREPRRPAQGAGGPARCHSGQNPEHQVRRQMHHGGPARRSLPTLTAGLLLTLSAVSDAPAGEWEQIRESYDNALKTYETRIDAAVTEAGDRLRARWQLEQATREREAKQREREAAERARGGK